MRAALRAVLGNLRIPEEGGVASGRNGAAHDTRKADRPSAPGAGLACAASRCPGMGPQQPAARPDEARRIADDAATCVTLDSKCP